MDDWILQHGTGETRLAGGRVCDEYGVQVRYMHVIRLFEMRCDDIPEGLFAGKEVNLGCLCFNNIDENTDQGPQVASTIYHHRGPRNIYLQVVARSNVRSCSDLLYQPSPARDPKRTIFLPCLTCERSTFVEKPFTWRVWILTLIRKAQKLYRDLGTELMKC